MAGRAAIFLDTAHVLALTNDRDQWHAVAVQWSERIASDGLRLITTEFVLIEIGNALAAVHARKLAVEVIRAMRSSDSVEIVPASRALFEAALALYSGRADKDWGLTDCSSFVTMTDRGITQALTVDQHFEQAGFRALLLER
jgi:predicted nucleic acid-binding protein